MTSTFPTPGVVRAATPADIEALVGLEQSFPGDRLSRASFRHFLLEVNADVLVVESAGQVVADAVLLYRHGSPAAHLYSLVVQPAQRGKGIGRRLLGAVDEVAGEKRCTAVRLEVREDNAAAIALYTKAGYSVAGRVEGYYQDGCAALRLRKKLTIEDSRSKIGG